MLMQTATLATTLKHTNTRMLLALQMRDLVGRSAKRDHLRQLQRMHYCADVLPHQLFIIENVTSLTGHYVPYGSLPGERQISCGAGGVGGLNLWHVMLLAVCLTGAGVMVLTQAYVCMHVPSKCVGCVYACAGAPAGSSAVINNEASLFDFIIRAAASEYGDVQRVLLAPSPADSRGILLAVTQLLLYEQWQRRRQEQPQQLLQRQQSQGVVGRQGAAQDNDNSSSSMTYRQFKSLCHQVGVES